MLCSDDRTRAMAIKLFGGVLNPVYTLTILKEAAQPGSVTGSFEEETAALVPVIREVGGMARPAVHSDTDAEGGSDMDLHKVSGKVGCGYAQLRQVISSSIAENSQAIIEDAKALRAELFQSGQDEHLAQDIIDAHGRLAKRERFFTPGRQVVLRAIREGATVDVVDGTHVAEVGIYNLVPDSSLHGDQAIEASLPAYNHDAWASSQVYDNIHHLYPYDKRQQEIAELIDAIGTMRALGVKDIDVRRQAT